MTNPFENETDTYHALINDEEQYSLWPAFLSVPDGWRIVHKADSRPGLSRLYQHSLDRHAAKKLQILAKLNACLGNFSNRRHIFMDLPFFVSGFRLGRVLN